MTKEGQKKKKNKPQHCTRQQTKYNKQNVKKKQQQNDKLTHMCSGQTGKQTLRNL